MKNVDRLARHITKYGSANIMIHTIPKTSNWLVCSKIEKNKWALTLCNPMGNVTYNLGIATDQQHLALWEQLTRLAIETQAKQILLAKQLKDHINKVIKNYDNHYKKFIKKENSRHQSKNISKNPKKLAKTTSKKKRKQTRL